MLPVPLIGESDDNATPQPDDDRLWAVTALIGCLDKPALPQWAAIETSKAAVDDVRVWQSRLANEGRDSAIDYLKNARFRAGKGQRSAKDLGSAVHEACERYALTGTRPDVDAEVRPFLVQFDKFLQEFQPEFTAVETTVYSPTYGYAGTCDGFMTVAGERLIFDYKTSRDSYDGRGDPKTPYPEVALQLAGYRFAEMAAVWRARRFEQFRRRYYLLSVTERELSVPVPEVDGGVAIQLTPDFYAVHPVRCDEGVHEAFLYVLEAARWHYETSKGVVGHPMTPPAPIPVDETDPFVGLPA